MEKKIPVQYLHPYPTDLDLSKYELRFWAEGDCMNSPDAPIRIRNGQRVMVHSYAEDFNIYRDIDKVCGKVCVVQYVAKGKRYFAVKQISFFDELAGLLRLTFYNPRKTDVYLNIDTIEKVYIVDGVEE